MPERTYSLADLFEIVTDTVPDRLALVAGSARLTYGELDARANRFANHVEGLGLAPGAHVGILAHNRAEWAEAMIGCYKSRTVPINLNYRYVVPELRYVIDNADLELLAFERSLTDLVAGALEDPGSGTGDRSGGPGSQATSDPGRLAHFMVIEDGAPPRDIGHKVDEYEAALAASSPDRSGLPRSGDDLYILYTGGTTGMPKGVMWRQEDIFFAAMGGGSWDGTPIDRPDELASRLPLDDNASPVMLMVAPLMHGNAQWGMWSAFMMGATAVLYTEHSYQPEVLWQLISDEGVASVALVGDAMARPLAETLANALPGTYDLSSLFAIASGGAMLSATVKAELKALLPNVLIMDRFGASETGRQGAVEEGATGPRFVMSEDTSVLDENLVPLVPGDGRVGRLARAGRVPVGYYKDPEKTAATFQVDAQGVRWSLPGDSAIVEADGTITVLGRGSASINSGGEKIFPEEVEAAVKTHPAVFDAIVVGLPDERFGQQVAVAVQIKAGANPPTLEALQEHCRTMIAGYKLPRRMVVIDEVPLTAAGKPDGKMAQTMFS